MVFKTNNNYNCNCYNKNLLPPQMQPPYRDKYADKMQPINSGKCRANSKINIPATVACEHISAHVQSSMARPRARSEQLSPSNVYAPELLAEVLRTKDQL